MLLPLRLGNDVVAWNSREAQEHQPGSRRAQRFLQRILHPAELPLFHQLSADWQDENRQADGRWGERAQARLVDSLPGERAQAEFEQAQARLAERRCTPFPNQNPIPACRACPGIRPCGVSGPPRRLHSRLPPRLFPTCPFPPPLSWFRCCRQVPLLPGRGTNSPVAIVSR